MYDFAKLTIAFETAKAEQTEKRLRAVAREANAVAREIKKAEVSVAGANAKQKNFNDTLTRSSGRLKVIGRDINRYLVLPLTAFIGLSAKAALDLNKGLGNVQALIPGTGDRIYELRDAMVALSTDTGKSFSDLSSGLYRTISVFQDNIDTMDRLRTATEMGIAGYASVEESVQLLSSVTRAYGDTSGAAVSKVADLAFETVRLGDTTIPALSAAMQVATDRAVRLGISQEELFATMATLTGITGDASMVATQFRSAMDSLLNPTDELNGLLARMGHASAAALIQERGMLGAITAIAREAERTGQPLQDFITRKEGITLVSRLATEQLDDFVWKLDEVADSTGAASEAYKGVTDGIAKFNFELDKAKQTLTATFAEIGQNMLPILLQLFDTLNNVVGAIALLPDYLQRGIVSFTVFAAGLATVIQLFGAIKSLTIVKLMADIGKQATATGSIFTGLTAAINPVVLIIAAIVLALGGLGMAIAANRRYVRELSDETETSLRRLSALQREMQTLPDFSASVNSAAVSHAQSYRVQGEIPLFSSAPTEGRLGTEGTMDLYDQLGEVIPSRSEIEKLLSDYSDNLRRLQDGILYESEQTLMQIQTEYASVVERYSNEMSADTRKNLLSAFSPLRGGQDELRDALADNDFQKIYELLQQRLVELKAIVDTSSSYLTVSSAGANIETIAPITAILEELIGTEAEMDNTTFRIQDANKQLSEIKGAQILLTDILAESEGMENTTVTKSWQEWFTEITGLDVTSIGGSNPGIIVAGMYSDFLDTIEQRQRDFATALGLPVNEVEIAQARYEKVLDDLTDLFSVPPWGTFKWNDWVISQADTSLINEYKEAVQGLADVYRQELSLAMQEFDIHFATLNEDIVNGKITIDDLRTAYDAFSDIAKDVTTRLEELRAAGYPEEDLAVFASVAAIATNNVDLLADAFERLNVVAGESNLDVPTLSFTEFLDALKSDDVKAFDVVKTHMREVKDYVKEAGLAVDYLDNTMTNFAETMVNAVATQIADALFSLGTALSDMNFEDFGSGVAQFGVNLMQLASQILIAAAFTALLPPPLGLGVIAGLPLFGTLLGIGAALGVGAGVVNSKINKNDSTSGGTDSSRVQIAPMAKGGVLDSPTLLSASGSTYLAGEAGHEAIMPLSRTASGDLGVAMIGSDSSAPQMNVTVNNFAGVEVEQEQDNDGNLSITLRRVVSGMVAGGELDRAFRSRYGVRAT